MAPIQEMPDFEDVMNDPEAVSDMNDGDMDDDDEDEEEDKMNYVEITLKHKNPPPQFELTYRPEVLDEPREFELPLRLKGVGERAGIQRTVKAVGVLSKLIIIGDPTKEEASRDVCFGKTTISKG